MPSHITDSAFLRDLYGTDAMRAVFEDTALLQKWLDVEVALAQAEGELGVIPAEAALAISKAGHAALYDHATLKRGIDSTLHPIVPLIRMMKAQCPGDTGEYVHYGATTQDIMDTAVVLQLKDALAIIEPHLAALLTAAAALARAHANTLMAGRTHGQHALPITFGFKVAVWVDELRRHQQRIAQCKPRVLVGQFGGAAGTLASVGAHGPAIRKRMMALLGVADPPITWHVAHDGFAELAGVLALVAGSCGKIANEIINLQRSELWEVEEPFETGKIGSSTMPHKRNPMICEAIVALARLCFNSARNGWDGLIQEHERDWSVNHMEWAYLPDLCVMTDGALTLTTRVLSTLHVHPARMARNAHALGGLMQSEAVMFELGKHIGKQSAHHVVYDCAMQTVDHDVPFRDALLAHPEVKPHFNEAQLDALLDPAAYTGLAAFMTEAILAQK